MRKLITCKRCYTLRHATVDECPTCRQWTEETRHNRAVFLILAVILSAFLMSAVKCGRDRVIDRYSDETQIGQASGSVSSPE